MDVNETYSDDHFTIYRNIESLCCRAETNLMLYVNYISKKYEKQKERGGKQIGKKYFQAIYLVTI